MAFSGNGHLVSTLAYADIFDYPLTAQELHFWCIKQKIKPGGSVGLKNKNIEMKKGYYFLRGRKDLIQKRAKRYTDSLHKWHIASTVGWWLKWIPTIQLVGVTGGLAMSNADQKDDIDVFIVTRRGTLWTSRILATIVVGLLGRRRKPGALHVTDKICLNMFMSEEALTIPKNEQDLFAAHEVLQMVPLWTRDGAYHTFLYQNRWVEEFLPNAWAQKRKEFREKSLEKKDVLLFSLLETPARIFQLWYMKRRRTTELVSDSELRFHPRDARLWVKKALSIRLTKVNAPLDKIFYRG